MGRSDGAERSPADLLSEVVGSMNWVAGETGLVDITDETLLGQLQAMLTSTHKTTDNWTRDRGCKLHGVNGCDFKCAGANRAQVPVSYKLVRALKNQNPVLWGKYSLLKTAISDVCKVSESAVKHAP